MNKPDPKDGPTQAQIEAAKAILGPEWREIIAAAAGGGGQTASSIRAENERVARMKTATIERCAQVVAHIAENCPPHSREQERLGDAVSAIRSLKDSK